MRESSRYNKLMLAAADLSSRLFRNNVGKCWIGRAIRTDEGMIIENARRFHAGLCTGSSDLVGWTPVTVTQAMVGDKLAVFTAIEVKLEGKGATEEQQCFLDAVKSDGGLSGVARTTEDVISIISQEVCI